MTNDNYRIDWACECVYELNTGMNAYTYLCSFHQIGAVRKNRETTVIKKIEKWLVGDGN